MCFCTGDSSVMQIAVDQQSTSSAGTSSASSSLPSEAASASAAVTLSAASAEPQPAARFVLWYLSVPSAIPMHLAVTSSPAGRAASFDYFRNRLIDANNRL